MFGWIRDFYRRHRRKIFITGIVAGGTYALTRYISWKLDEWQNQQASDRSLQAKKEFHFQSNQRTCTMTFISFLPNIRNTVVEKLNTEELLEVLKMKPSNKLEVWEQLKILSLARVLCSVVANVILLVFLKVELNIIGGYMFVNSSNEDTEVKPDGEMNEVQVKYLNNVRFFMEERLPILIDDCMHLVTEVIGTLSLKEKISHAKLKELMHQIINELKEKHKDSNSNKHSFCTYMIDPQWSEIDTVISDTYTKMTSESIDVLESADCARVIDECLGVGTEQVLESMKNSFYGHEEDPEAIVSLETCVKTSFYKQIELPLAKIVPLLNSRIHEIFKAGSNEFLDVLFSQGLLREFCNNIYDAFSKEYASR